jgi:transcriptional regulator with XRE-family HTH domain
MTTGLAAVPESEHLTFATALAALRKDRGYSARRLSLEAGLSESYVGKVESGRMEPSFRAFCLIVHVLKLNNREINFLVLREVVANR